MMGILYEKKVTLLEREFTVYLKEVPTKLGKGGMVEATTVRAFIREAK